MLPRKVWAVLAISLASRSSAWAPLHPLLRHSTAPRTAASARVIQDAKPAAAPLSSGDSSGGDCFFNPEAVRCLTAGPLFSEFSRYRWMASALESESSEGGDGDGDAASWRDLSVVVSLAMGYRPAAKAGPPNSSAVSPEHLHITAGSPTLLGGTVACPLVAALELELPEPGCEGRELLEDFMGACKAAVIEKDNSFRALVLARAEKSRMSSTHAPLARFCGPRNLTYLHWYRDFTGVLHGDGMVKVKIEEGDADFLARSIVVQWLHQANFLNSEF